MTRLLDVHDLNVSFRTSEGDARVVNGLDYHLEAGETLAIVGESGSGKSVSVLSLLRLLPEPPATITGRVMFLERDLLKISEGELRDVRGNGIGMVFQDPMTSLNPLLPIGRQITESMEVHLGVGARVAKRRAAELLDQVGMASPRERLEQYPHELSGGMRQRVMIAMALACDPAILIADEATTALDVTIQAQIIELVKRLQDELGLGVIWITHDLSVVAGMADRVLVMYAGRIVESAPTRSLFANPQHPYTSALLGSAPILGAERVHRLAAIEGMPPDPLNLPVGCPFWRRCTERHDPRCETLLPSLREFSPGHHVRAFYGSDREVGSHG